MSAEPSRSTPAATHRLGRGGLVGFNLAMIAAVAALAALGTWQVQRRAWKLDLIAQVDTRVHAAPVPAPGPSAWSSVTAASDGYRHIEVTGTYLPEPAALVQALTELGSGYWVLAPLRTSDGFTVLINRGFVPSERRDPSAWRREDGTVTVTGLLRVTEPGGGFLHGNDPARDRWYSRDVAAIAQARGLDRVAPYFIDAAATSGAEGLPVGGLTVVAFPNNHLVYAITWYVLAAMAAGALVYVDRDAIRARREASPIT